MLSTLSEQPCIWAGSMFVSPSNTALHSPFNLSPHLHTVPTDLHCFGRLFQKLGVRAEFESFQYIDLLERLARDSPGVALTPDLLPMVLAVVQHLASPKHHPLPQRHIYVPDRTGVLTPSHELIYDDAPWLGEASMLPPGISASSLSTPAAAAQWRRVHSNVSHEVADRLGAKSLRRWLISRNSDTLALGQENVEAFGQHESLTSRLHNILELYADGAGILHELIQNADDAAATKVAFMLDQSMNGTSSLLSPMMGAWQGPALYAYNDSTFKPHDFRNICSIGSNAKLASCNAIGRFGLGFNSVYHFTDVPSFVSGEHVVFFDPHAEWLPGATPHNPGLRIRFPGAGYLDQFPDQFSPYLHFGCDMTNAFEGTLFRFPLRTSDVASSSQLRSEAYSCEAVQSLLAGLQTRASELLLFLKHVRTIEVYVKSSKDSQPSVLFSVKRDEITPSAAASTASSSTQPISTQSDGIMGFVREERSCSEKEGPTSGAFYDRLLKTDPKNLPRETKNLRVTISRSGAKDKKTTEEWIVCSSLGHNAPRICKICLTPEGKHLKLMPWGGAAALIRTSTDCVDEEQEEPQIQSLGTLSSMKGHAFCFLPLPTENGLPVHTNGYFELSANRRDIWYGDDMVGAGRLRAEWNSCLIQDVVAPSYMRLLLQVRDRLREASGCYGDVAGYYALWPQSRPPEPWGGLVDVLYQLLLQQPMLYSEMHDGVWVSPVGAVFAMHLKHEAEKARAMDNALLRSGMPLVRVPDSVAQLLEAAAKQQFTELRWADPPMVRTWLAAQREWEAALTRIEGMELLEYCLLELDEDVSSLFGLQLLPLVDTSWGRFDAAESGSPPLLLSSSGDRPLLSHRPSLLVEVDLSSPVGQQLARVAAGGQTNLRLFSAELLPSLLPFLLPASWRGLEVVDLTPTVEARTGVGSDGAEPSCSWLLQLWEFIGRHHSKVQLGDLLGWPLLPVEGELQAYALPSGGLQLSRMVDFKDMDLSWASCLRKAGCLSLHHGVRQAHPQLQRVVHEVSACGVLRALRVAAGGPGVSSPQDLSQSVSRLFERVERHERQSLRAMLAERRHVEMSALRSDKDLLAMLGWLPVYEVHLSVRHEDEAQRAAVESVAAEEEERRNNVEGELLFTALDLNQHRLAPSGVSATLLDERFVCYTNESELELLQLAGLVRLDRSRFFRDYIFPRLPVLPVSARDSAMLSVLHGLHGLCAEDSTFLEALRELSFVPVQSGLLRRPDELFHPKVSEASELLDKSEVHPSGAFADESVLGVLERLGLRVQVTRDAVLQSARSIEALCPIDTEAAVRRAKALLQYVDAHANAFVSDGSNIEDAEFLSELTTIAWLPVVTEPPHSLIPWGGVHRPVEAPSAVRPAEDAWVVSHCLAMLDGSLSSNRLRAAFGWDNAPRPAVVCAQLIHCASLFTHSVAPDEEFLWSRLLRPAYGLLMAVIDTPAFTGVHAMLRSRPCLWISANHGFLSPEHVAFEAPSVASRYLGTVGEALMPFEALLRALGVRQSFNARDFEHVNSCFVRDFGASKLPPEQLSICVAALEASHTAPLATETTHNFFLPDADSILRPAAELIFDDAPWMSAALFQRQDHGGAVNLIHSSLNNAVAERLGARSLRYLLLLEEKLTDTIPCPSVQQIGRTLNESGIEAHVLFDLLDAADALGAKAAHFVLDRRSHPTQSLLSHALAPFQSEALCLYLPGLNLSAEEVCRQDASSLLLGLRNVEVMSTSEWLPKQSEPTRTLQVHRDIYFNLPDEKDYLATDESRFAPSSSQTPTTSDHPRPDEGASMTSDFDTRRWASVLDADSADISLPIVDSSVIDERLLPGGTGAVQTDDSLLHGGYLKMNALLRPPMIAMNNMRSPPQKQYPH
ncbi:hypothetical protein AB1Y20_012926 [Prymnesium parvum]|uniref:Sacsin/Nov domain-containing protein n=1 Tax=Prymnesium parvum TaxID=97485 RepID=A0AB34IK76_PRYPA